MLLNKLQLKINFATFTLQYKLKLRHIKTKRYGYQFHSPQELVSRLQLLLSMENIHLLIVIFKGCLNKHAEKVREAQIWTIFSLIADNCRFLTALLVCNTSNNIIDILISYPLMFLKRLKLINNQINLETFKRLIQIKFRYLTQIQIHNNSIKKNGIQLLKGCQQWPSLKTIRLKQCEVSQQAIGCLKQYSFSKLQKIENKTRQLPDEEVIFYAYRRKIGRRSPKNTSQDETQQADESRLNQEWTTYFSKVVKKK